jgi:hypothetical protein
MKPAIDFVIYSEDSTLRGDIDLYVPSEQDNRVFKEEYELKAGRDLEGRYFIKGNVKCNNRTDADIVLGNIKQLCTNNALKIEQGSFIAIGEWMHDEEIPTKCKRTILWSK